MLLYKRLSIFLVFIIMLNLGCLSVKAGEYKPLELDLPAINYNEKGTIAYTVKKGDTLFSIGKRFNSDVELIVALNSNIIKDPNQIVPGQEVLIPQLLEPTRQVISQNQEWQTARVTILNAGRISSRYDNNLFYVPTTGVLTSLFGIRHNEFHTGIDFANKVGTPIRAALAGRVTFVGWRGNYGKTVIIDHYNGYETLYGHNSKILVKPGQWVEAQEVIALMGNTGRSTGPHLHFEIRKNKKAVNPLNYLKR